MKNRAPDKIDKDGNSHWYNKNGEHHNDNGYPALIYSWGAKEWYKNGLCHNENGPAITYNNSEPSWYINGVRLTKDKFLQYKIKIFITDDNE